MRPKSDRLASLIAEMPNGGTITTDPDTAEAVVVALTEASRRIYVWAFPTRRRDRGMLYGSWEGPAEGERHEVHTWL